MIERRRGLPGGRAVLGALLMAIAAVGVFLAYTDATTGPTGEVVVATRDLAMGHRIAADDVRLVEADLPAAVADGAFDDTSLVVGRVVLGPVGSAAILQRAALTDDVASEPAHEVAMVLPRAQVAVGRLKQGERVDAYVTTEDRTSPVVRGARVVQIGGDGDGSLTSDREVTIVVAVATDETVADLVHALRTGEVTVVRSTLAEGSG